MRSMIPYGTQWITDSEIDEVIEVLRSPWLSPSPKLTEFETTVAAYCGARYAVAFSSGTAALHGAVFAARISPGDERVTSAFSFVASSNCVVYQSGIPRLCDIDERTYNMNPKLLAEIVSERTKVIIPVHFAGLPCDMLAIKEIADKVGAVVIEDASHALGASYESTLIGSCTHSDMVCLSFHPVKIITTSEGGMVLTNDKTYYECLVTFRNHGITSDPKYLLRNEGSWYYEMQELGYNYRMTNFQAAIGLRQMDRIDEFVQRRRAIAREYDKAFAHLDGLITPFEPANFKSSYHLYVIRLNIERLPWTRRRVFEVLREQGVSVQVHYIPIHYHPYYQRTFGTQRGDFPVTERVYESIMSLPIYPKMTDDVVAKVVDIVMQTVSEARR